MTRASCALKLGVEIAKIFYMDYAVRYLIEIPILNTAPTALQSIKVFLRQLICRSSVWASTYFFYVSHLGSDHFRSMTWTTIISWLGVLVHSRNICVHVIHDVCSGGLLQHTCSVMIFPELVLKFWFMSIYRARTYLLTILLIFESRVF